VTIHETIARSTAMFGAGTHLPYDHALRDPTRTLYLHEYQSTDSEPMVLNVHKFRAPADLVDAATVSSVDGPILDVGCGPGRLVRAAIVSGRLAFGIDLSIAAVELANDQGLPVLHRSVFQSLPGEGTWGAALLIDGNIGIGGDPVALLRRCLSLIRPNGRVIVETHPDESRDRVFDGIIIDDLDRSSLPFPWAEVGMVALIDYAAAAGLRCERAWSSAGRSFVELARA
jgi:SAM-dependent methyltransferase